MIFCIQNIPKLGTIYMGLNSFLYDKTFLCLKYLAIAIRNVIIRALMNSLRFMIGNTLLHIHISFRKLAPIAEESYYLLMRRKRMRSAARYGPDFLCL